MKIINAFPKKNLYYSISIINKEFSLNAEEIFTTWIYESWICLFTIKAICLIKKIMKIPNSKFQICEIKLNQNNRSTWSEKTFSLLFNQIFLENVCLFIRNTLLVNIQAKEFRFKHFCALLDYEIWHTTYLGQIVVTKHCKNWFGIGQFQHFSNGRFEHC